MHCLNSYTVNTAYNTAYNAYTAYIVANAPTDIFIYGLAAFVIKLKLNSINGIQSKKWDCVS